MRRPPRVFSFIALAIIIVVALWWAKIPVPGRSGPPNPNGAAHSALASLAEFVKSRFTGGIGVMLSVDNATGCPSVRSMIPGSPAEGAGLRTGDLITTVDDRATAGQPLAQVVEAMRGITGGKVTLTVQRPGSTNLTLVIQRSSWNALRGTNSFPLPTGGAVTNVIPLLRLMPKETD